MDASQVGKLVQLLSEKTESREIRWAPNVIEEGEYESNFTNYTIKLRRIPTLSTDILVTINIIDSRGIDLGEISLDFDDFIFYGKTLRHYKERLYNLVRMNASGLSEAVESLIDELENISNHFPPEEDDLPF